MKVNLEVNGRRVSADVEERTLLVELLRKNLLLTGTHVGCDTTQCGACVVHVDGLDGNICRCTGYHNIVKAVAAAAQTMRATD